MRSIALALLVASIVLPAEGICQDTTVTVTATFVDFDGKPIQDVRLEALFIQGSPTAVSGADGSVVLNVAWPPERVDPPRSWTELPPLENHLLLRAVGDGTTHHCILQRVKENLRIDLGKIRLGTGSTIEGRVVDAEGDPLPGTRVEACVDVQPTPEDEVAGCSYDVGGSYRCFYYLPQHGSPAFSDSNGHYRLDGIPDTFVRVVARRPGSLHTFSPTIALLPGRVSSVDDIVLRWAEPSQVIRGRVVGPDGMPQPDVPLDAGGALDATRTWTRADGSFQMVVPAGRSYSVCSRSSPLKEGVAAGEVILATRAAGGRPLGHRTLLRFTLRAGETKVVRLP